jgi:transposase, IS30 family
MTKSYRHLDSAERAIMHSMLAEGSNASQIGRALRRDRSTICRELRRNGAGLIQDAPDGTAERGVYDPIAADKRYRDLFKAPGPKKLETNSQLLDNVRGKIRAGWSPEQIAGHLKSEYPNEPQSRVCHETIYNAIYVMPHGDLKSELVACLRFRTSGKRRPRSAGRDRAKIAGMTSIHVRPPEVEDRVVPGHWEGDLIKGAANRSCIGTLVERSSRLVRLVKMPDGCARSLLTQFSEAFAPVDAQMKKTLTYDQGSEMALHKEFTAKTGLKVYFCDPHSPWQRGTNENTNGLIRQYFPKGMDLSRVTQRELDAVASMLNTRPRKIHKWRTPIQIFNDLECAARATLDQELLSPLE